MTEERAAVLIVTYGESRVVEPLLRSLQPQANAVDEVLIWHNGPGVFDDSLTAAPPLRVRVMGSGENLGYGGGINRLWPHVTAPVAVIVNPDVVLSAACVSNLVKTAMSPPAPVLVAGALGGDDGRLNAFALSLTWDCVGINVDRGMPMNAVPAEPSHATLAPSGALFAVNRRRWEEIGGGPLFAESLFLYMEDLALGLRVRRLGGQLRFCSNARGEHRFSHSTGRRSALKLYHVERNRLWLQRALGGRPRALATLPFTIVRLLSYWQAARGRAPQATDATETSVDALFPALLAGWRDGLLAAVPEELQRYLDVGSHVPLRPFVAPLRDQLKDPTA